MFCSACRGTEIEDLLSKVAWFSNMRDQPAIEPFEQAPMPMPEGTIPIGGSAPVLAGPEAYDAYENPIERSESSLAAGQELYGIYCSVCHGPAGRGEGSIAGPAGPFPAGLIPQLVTERARAFSDGYLFGIITAGRGLMPNYRRIPERERWHIVHYVRQLQSAGESAE